MNIQVTDVLPPSPRPAEKDRGTMRNVQALKVTIADGKHRLTDVAETELLLRLIQSLCLVQFIP